MSWSFSWVPGSFFVRLLVPTEKIFDWFLKLPQRAAHKADNFGPPPGEKKDV